MYNHEFDSFPFARPLFKVSSGGTTRAETRYSRREGKPLSNMTTAEVRDRLARLRDAGQGNSGAASALNREYKRRLSIGRGTQSESYNAPKKGPAESPPARPKGTGKNAKGVKKTTKKATKKAARKKATKKTTTARGGSTAKGRTKKAARKKATKKA